MADASAIMTIFWVTGPKQLVTLPDNTKRVLIFADPLSTGTLHILSGSTEMHLPLAGVVELAGWNYGSRNFYISTAALQSVAVLAEHSPTD